MKILPFACHDDAQMHNALADVVLPVISGNAWKLLSVIIRQTKGWNRETAAMSYSDLKRLSGIASDATISAALKELRGFQQKENFSRLIFEINGATKWEKPKYALNLDAEIEWEAERI